MADPRPSLGCAICLKPFGGAFVRMPRSLPCGHSFCTGCILSVLWKCPMQCPPPTLCPHPKVNFALVDVLGIVPEPEQPQQQPVAVQSVNPPIAIDELLLPVYTREQEMAAALHVYLPQPVHTHTCMLMPPGKEKAEAYERASALLDTHRAKQP